MRLAKWLSAMPFRCVADVKTRWNFIEQSQTMRPIQDTINQAWKTIFDAQRDALLVKRYKRLGWNNLAFGSKGRSKTIEIVARILM